MAFITFEGPDGVGKTTQIRLLANSLEESGYRVLITREPGGTDLGKKIRQLLLDEKSGFFSFKTELLLYAADRAQHIEELIKPALASGKVVLCDRFIDSTIAYQGYGRKLPLEVLTEVNEIATGGFKPDLTLIFDLLPERAHERIRGERSQTQEVDRIELEGLAFQQRVREGYLEILKQESERCQWVDADQKVEDIAKVVNKKVLEFLKQR